MSDGGLYRLLVDPMALVYSNGKLDEPSSFKEAHAEHVWWVAMEIDS